MITREDFGTIMDLLLANYGDKAFPVDDPQKMNRVLNLWTVMFQDDDPKEVLIAVKDCIATLQFPPKIADIKSRISQNRMAGQPTGMEAWTMVYKGILDIDGIKSARKLFDRLPPIAQKLVGAPEQLLDWKEAEGKVLTTVVASNFMRDYKILAEREASYHALPADMQIAESWKLPKAEEKPKTLPKPEFHYDENGKRVVHLGFEPEPYMMPTINGLMAEGLSDIEIRKQVMSIWG